MEDGLKYILKKVLSFKNYKQRSVYSLVSSSVSLTLYNGIVSYFKAELAQFHLLSSIFIHNAVNSLCSHISYSCSCSLMQRSSLLSICFSLRWIAWVPSSLSFFFFLFFFSLFSPGLFLWSSYQFLSGYRTMNGRGW